MVLPTLFQFYKSTIITRAFIILYNKRCSVSILQKYDYYFLNTELLCNLCGFNSTKVRLLLWTAESTTGEYRCFNSTKVRLLRRGCPAQARRRTFQFYKSTIITPKAKIINNLVELFQFYKSTIITAYLLSWRCKDKVSILQKYDYY